MSKKPQRRLVSKGQYARLITTRAAILLLSLACVFAGLYTMVKMAESEGQHRHSKPGLMGAFLDLLVCTVPGVCCPIMFVGAFQLFKKERTIERVAPITRHSTSFLPPQESLVRASDLPPSQQQAELLRAAPRGSETPTEELLRATTKTGRGED